MTSIQNDSAYKSCIKAFDDSIGKILKTYARPGVNVEVFGQFSDRLAALYPVVNNLAFELNNFYDAGIEIPEDDFESDVEINVALKELHARIADFLSSDVAFADIKAPDIEDIRFAERLSSYHERFDKNYDEDEREKGIYWLNNLVTASYDVILAEHVRTEEKISRRIDEGETVNKVTESFFRRLKRHFSEKERIETEDCIYSAIVDACCDAVAEKNVVSINDIDKSFKSILHERYDIFWEDEADTLRSNGRELLSIINDGRRRFSALSAIEEKLEDVQELLRPLDSVSIRRIIEKQAEQKNKIVNIEFSLADLQQILHEYPDFEILQQEEDKKYAQYDKLAAEYKFYEETEIDDEKLLEYFNIQLKQWIMFTRQDAENLVEGLQSLENEKDFPICGFNNIDDFKTAVLETARDITLIGNVSPNVILTQDVDEDGDPVVVLLNQSGIGERYVRKLAYAPETIGREEFKNLNLLLADFLESCEEYKDYIVYNKDELRQLSVMSDEEYIRQLSALPESLNKRNMIKYSGRAFAEQFRVQTQNLYNAQEDLVGEARNIHASATDKFENFLEIGLDIYPHITHDSIIENSVYFNSILSSLSLPAVYLNKKPNEKEIETTIDYSLSQNGYSVDENNLLKYALTRYQKDIVAAHEAVIAGGKLNNRLKYKTGHYAKMAKIWAETDNNCDRINELADRQEEIYRGYLKFKEYEKKILPKDNVLDQLFFLNHKARMN